MEPTLWWPKLKLLPLREGLPVITGQKRTEMLWYIFTKKKPCQNFDTLSPLKYSNVFYGCPSCSYPLRKFLWIFMDKLSSSKKLLCFSGIHPCGNWQVIWVFRPFLETSLPRAILQYGSEESPASMAISPRAWIKTTWTSADQDRLLPVLECLKICIKDKYRTKNIKGKV